MKRLLLLLLVCGLLTACATSPAGRSQLMLISPESAIVESKKAYLSTVGELNKKDKLANDPALSKRVVAIGAMSDKPAFLSTHPAPGNREEALAAMVPAMRKLNPTGTLAAAHRVDIVR